MLQADWLVQIYANNTNGVPCIGTGYAIGNGLILTARHVVIFDKRAANPQLKLVLPKQDKFEMSFTDADIVFKGDEVIDLAIIRCPKTTPFQHPKVTLATVNPSTHAQWSSRGFLRAGKEGETRTDRGVSGTVAGDKDHEVELHSSEEVTEKNGWAGLSGAPVFIDTRMVAVIAVNYTTIKRYFIAVSIPWLFQHNEAFREVLKQPIDNQFIEKIKSNICNELNSPEVAILRGEIRQQLDKIESPDDEIKGDSTSHLTERLFSLDTLIAIEEVLYNATMECLDKRGKKFTEAKPHSEAIKQAAQQILGWLVLSAIPYEVMHETIQDNNLPGLYFEIPVLTEGAVEIIISRKFQHKADLKIKTGGSDVTGNHQITIKPKLFNWQEKATVADIKRLIWNRVFKEDPRDAPLSVTETKRLNAELRLRLKTKWYKEHYYLAIEGMDNLSQQHFQNICQQLLTELDELAVVSFGTEEQQNQQLFLLELDLMAAINQFLTDINRALA